MSEKVRVYEVAKELGVPSKQLVAELQQMGVDVKSHASTITTEVADRLKNGAKAPPVEAKPEPKPKPKPAPEPETKPKPEPELEPEPEPDSEPEAAPASEVPTAAEGVHVHRGITVKDFADKIGRGAPEVIKSLMGHGAMKSITQSLTDEEILVVADDLGVEIEVVDPEVEERLETDEEALSPDALEPRPPVVTVMGHVDHGKTTVLDKIRQSDVVAAEHGGITQHIGAYQVTKDGERITFIDTPGHEAFTSMRARGAQVTDIAILVVAADDGVMPQTLEAIDHARAADVPIVVAVNKVDKPGSDPTRVRTELSERGLQPQEWGGDALFVDMSAITGEGMDDLLTGVVLVAEDLELKAASSGTARGVILEAHLDKGRGPVATVLVQHGVLRVGDPIVAGTAWGKVRAMLDEWGESVEQADPSRPVMVLGWNSVPESGDEMRVQPDERRARQIAQERDATRRRAEMVTTPPAVTLDQLLQQTNELRLIVKADVRGSLEAVASELGKIDVGDVEVNVIRSAVGAIVASDVDLARASDAIVVGFNVRPDATARETAEREGVEIRTYRVIYELTDDISKALKGMLAPEFRERVLGQAEIRETFKVPRTTAAGCYVTHGEILRNAKARLLRDGTVVHEGRIGSLRRFSDDVREVQQGFECGITLENYSDVKIGDIIEAFEVVEVAPT